jgi:hypothetical protein
MAGGIYLSNFIWMLVYLFRIFAATNNHPYNHPSGLSQA